MTLAALAFAASLAQAAPVVQAAPAVHVHFHTPKNRGEARLFVRMSATEDRWAFVCSAPCKADLPPGVVLRAVLEDHDDEPHEFTLTNDMGGAVEVEAKRGGRGALAGGIVMTSIGGLSALVGIVLLAVSSAAETSDRSSFQTAGIVCFGGGAALTAGGITMIVNRSYEPVVRQRSWHGDDALLRSLPTASPMSLTVRF